MVHERFNGGLRFSRTHSDRPSRKDWNELGHRIVAYVTGQLIVSALFATYTSILLTILHVPMSILLGVLAGMVDILPKSLESLIAMVPASLMALTVSPTTALMVIGGYLFYHGIEDYLIVPKVYGNKLKISTLAVLLAMLVGGVLAGVFGAIVSPALGSGLSYTRASLVCSNSSNRKSSRTTRTCVRLKSFGCSQHLGAAA